MQQLNTPILFLVFNRLDTTALVFAEIKKIKPKKLFVASDGPRSSVVDEKKYVEEIRVYILENIDWPCEVKTLFRDKNMGCKMAVSSAIDWFFEHVEEGIILEDDCLPDLTFFSFCEELLKKYRDDERIMHIGGSNFQNGIKRGGASYYFSLFSHIWGWATWRRAWNMYDVSMSTFPKFDKTKKINQIFKKTGERIYWNKTFKDTHKGLIDTWDYSWLYACLYHGGLSCIPNVNLVKNIGFGKQSTHTSLVREELIVDIDSLSFPLTHPSIISAHNDADDFTNKKVYKTFLLRFLGIQFFKKIKLYSFVKRIFIRVNRVS